MMFSMDPYSALRCGGVFVYNAVESRQAQLRLLRQVSCRPTVLAYGEST